MSMTDARVQRLFLIPVGKENEHQRTIDGTLPARVLLHSSLTTLLPCWGVTDGNYLVRNGLKAERGDILAFIRAQSKG